jgi:hypothetical protein
VDAEPAIGGLVQRCLPLSIALRVPILSHKAFTQYFPDSVPPGALSILRHQPWSMLSRILWDQIFGLAQGGRQRMLRGYCNKAVDRINRN